MQADRVRYHKPADVWAVGVIFVQLVAGNVIGGRATIQDHIKDVVKVVGHVDKSLAKKFGWKVPQEYLADRLAASPRVRCLVGGEATNAHGKILKYDPAMRPTAGNVHSALIF